MLLRKQKINICSKIVSRSLLVLHQYFSAPEQYEAFQIAESEENVKEYLDTKRQDLSPETRNDILKYLTLLENLEPISIQRVKETLLSSGFDREALGYYEDKGIITEYEYFKKEQKEKTITNGKAILKLYEKEIKLIDQNKGVILKLDPELSILKRFDEMPKSAPTDEEIETMFEKDNSMILGEAILKRISPQPNGILIDIDASLKEKYIKYIYKDILRFLELDDQLTRADIDRIAKDRVAFLEYAIKQEDEPQFPAFMALSLERIEKGFHNTAQYLVMLWQLGQQYKKIYKLRDQDYLALIRLYEFIVGNWQRIEDNPENVNEAAEIVKLKTIAHRELGEYYEYFWEWEEAADNYKNVAQVTSANNMPKEFEGALFRTISCLENCLQHKKAIDHSIAALNGSRSTWQLSQHFEISKTMRMTLAAQLASFLQSSDIEYSEIEDLLTKSQLSDSVAIAQFFDSIKDDEVSSHKLEELQKIIVDFHTESNEYFGTDQSPDERVEIVLSAIGFIDSTVDSYQAQLYKIEPLVDQVKPELKLLFQLHKVKLNYLKNDYSSVEEFEKLLPLTSRFSGLFKPGITSHWYNEYLRALSLTINNKSDQTYPRIEHVTEKAIGLQLQGYLENYNETNAWAVMQTDWENTFRALLICIESCDDFKIRQKILSLLWNTLVFCQKAFHQFGKTNGTIVDYKKHEVVLNELRDQVWEFHGSGNNQNYLKPVRDIIKKIRDSEYPEYRKTKSYADYIKRPPDENSILFHLFTNIDAKRRLLILSYKKEGHYPNGQSFKYSVDENFEEVEHLIEAQKNNSDNIRKAEGMLSLLSDESSMKRISQEFSRFLNPTKNINPALTAYLNSTLDTSTRAQRTNFYCDQYLHEFPLEMVNNQSGIPIGTTLNLSSILFQSKEETSVRLENGIALFSGVPGSRSFPMLSDSLTETSMIVQTLNQYEESIPIQTYTRNDANIKNLKAAIQNRRSIIHLAVHGAASAELPPETASLVLSPIDINKPSSSLLIYQEILNLDLGTVDLVVLSACNSSVGKTQKASPMQGLAYAFLKAGAKFVVASRMEVSDAQTAKIMNQFYKFLLEDRDVLVAMKNTRAHFYHNGGVDKKDMACWGVWM